MMASIVSLIRLSLVAERRAYLEGLGLLQIFVQQCVWLDGNYQAAGDMMTAASLV